MNKIWERHGEMARRRTGTKGGMTANVLDRRVETMCLRYQGSRTTLGNNNNKKQKQQNESAFSLGMHNTCCKKIKDDGSKQRSSL
jgi:hypothetical protein